jgi:hypothetical protein
MQKLNIVKYYLDKFRPLKVNMDILERLYEVPSEIFRQKKSQVPIRVCVLSMRSQYFEYNILCCDPP